jgi:hypothetical protein
MGIEQRAVTGLLPRVGARALTVSPSKGLPRPSDPPLRPAVTGAPEKVRGIFKAPVACTPGNLSFGPAEVLDGKVRLSADGVERASRGEGGAR